MTANLSAEDLAAYATRVNTAESSAAAANSRVQELTNQLQQMETNIAANIQAQLQQAIGSAVDINKVLMEQRKIMAASFRQNFKPYDGTRDASTISGFLDNIEAYQEAAGLTVDNIITLMPTLLSSKALDWWEYYKKQELPTVRTTSNDVWKTVRLSIENEFLPVQYRADLRVKLHTTDCRRGLMNFVTRFRRIVRQLGDTVTSAEVWDAMISKIDADAELHLLNAGITTPHEGLERLAVYADAIDKKRTIKTQIHGGSNKFKSYKNYNRTSTSNSHVGPSHPNYMDVDATKLRDYHQNSKASPERKPFQKKDTSKFEHIDIDMTNYNDWDIPTTNKLRKFLADNKGCFYCRKLNADHGSRTCPKKAERRKAKQQHH